MPDPVVPPPAAPATPAAPIIDVAAIAAAVVAALPKPAAPPVPAPAPQTPATPIAPTDAERLAVLEKRDRDNIEKTIQATRSGAIDAALKGAEKDFNATQIEALRAIFETKHGKNVVVEGDKVFYNSPETGKIEVGVQLAKFLASDTALALKPPPTLPGGPGLSPSNNQPAAQPAAHPWAEKTFKEVSALAQTDPKSFRELTSKHPEAWAKILGGAGG